MSFTEANTVEQMTLDAVTHLAGAAENWEYLPGSQLPRQSHEVMVEPWVRASLIRLNPDIAAQPDRADEVIYNLRACILVCNPTGC